MQYRQIRIIAGKGSGAAQFRRELRGIALDARGALVAAGDSEVKVFDAAGALARTAPGAVDRLLARALAAGLKF
mgnify:CR=1 FL=1